MWVCAPFGHVFRAITLTHKFAHSLTLIRVRENGAERSHPGDRGVACPKTETSARHVDGTKKNLGATTDFADGFLTYVCRVPKSETKENGSWHNFSDVDHRSTITPSIVPSDVTGTLPMS